MIHKNRQRKYSISKEGDADGDGINFCISFIADHFGFGRIGEEDGQNAEKFDSARFTLDRFADRCRSISFTDLELVLRLWSGGLAGLTATGLFEIGKTAMQEKKNP